MRFLAVLAGTCLFVTMIMGTIYFWGLGQIFPKFDHPFFAHSGPWVVVPFAWSDQNPEVVSWLDIYRGKTGDLVIDQESSTKTLVSVLSENPHRRWILNIKQNAMDIDRQLATVLTPFLKTQELVIQSEFDVVLRSTHEEMANTPFGSSQSDSLRLASFQGMAPWSNGLLPAVPFKGDILISALKWRSTRLLSPEIINEMHRRQKTVIVGPLSTAEEFSQAQSLGPIDGFYFREKSLYQDFLTSAARHKSAAPIAQ